MDTIFMNSENNKTFKPHVLVLKRTNILDLRTGEKIIALKSYLLLHIEKHKNLIQ